MKRSHLAGRWWEAKEKKWSEKLFVLLIGNHHWILITPGPLLLKPIYFQLPTSSKKSSLLCVKIAHGVVDRLRTLHGGMVIWLIFCGVRRRGEGATKCRDRGYVLNTHYKAPVGVGRWRPLGRPWKERSFFWKSGGRLLWILGKVPSTLISRPRVFKIIFKIVAVYRKCQYECRFFDKLLQVKKICRFQYRNQERRAYDATINNHIGKGHIECYCLYTRYEKCVMSSKGYQNIYVS